MTTELTLSRKAMILVAVPLVFELVFVGTLGALLYQVDRERAQEAHSSLLTAHYNNMLRFLLERIVSNIVYKTIPSDKAHRKFRVSGKQMREELEQLRTLSADNEHEREVTSHIDSILLRNSDRSKKVVGLQDEGTRLMGIQAVVDMQNDMDELCGILQTAVEEQQGKQAEEKRRQAHYRELVELVLTVGVASNILIAVVLAIYFNRGTSKRLASLMDNIVLMGHDHALNPPMEGNDEIAEIDKVFRSMSERLQTARKNERAVLENALAVICSINSKGNVVQINPACKTLWDLDPASIVGLPVTNIVVDSDKERTHNFFERLISKESSGTLDNRIKKGDGAEADMHWIAQWSSSEKSLFCVAQDVSAEKEIERIKQEFVAMVSHDLRAPLMSIQIIIELLAAGRFGELTAEGKTRLSLAEDEVDRLMRMIKDLLDLERLESGAGNLDMQPTPIDNVLREAYDVLSVLADKSSIVLEIDEHENYIVNCEQDRIVQVLVNLVANSIKFSPNNSTIRIAITPINGQLEIGIADQGRGVPKELQDKIFDRFRQVERNDSKVKGGAGLGLAICKTLVEMHGGKIGVRCPESGGSIFWFTLPRN